MAGAMSIGLWPLLVTVLNSLKNGNMPPKVTLIALISEGLGFGIVLGSTMVKMPQILAVVHAKSADGLSPLAFELETLGLAIAATYGTLNKLAFSAYGESAVRCVDP
jgi:mannose-P-dolichol utilization defect protein 1